MSTFSIWLILRRYQTHTSIPIKISAHKFRHGFDTHQLDRGADVPPEEQANAQDFLHFMG